jgi:hypothetical protein
MPQPQEYTLDVDADHRIEHVFVIFSGVGPFAFDPGIIEKAVDRTVGVKRRSYVVLDLDRFGDVSRDKAGVPALLPDDAGRGFAARRIAIDSDDFCPALREGEGGCATDPVCGTGDQRHFAGEIEIHEVSSRNLHSFGRSVLAAHLPGPAFERHQHIADKSARRLIH